MNHYPLIGRTVPRSCADASGTADPFAAITCPKCRERLASKVRHEARQSHEGETAGHRKLHAGTARHFADILAA